MKPIDFARRYYGWIVFSFIVIIIASLISLVAFEDLLFFIPVGAFVSAWACLASGKRGYKLWGIDFTWHFLEFTDNTDAYPTICFIESCIASIIGGLFFIILLLINIAQLFVF